MKFLKTTKGKIIVSVMAVAIILGIAFSIYYAFGREKGYRIISVSEIVGEVKVDNNGTAYDAYTDMTISDGYALSTGTESYVRMELDDDKYIKLEEESRAVFEKLGKKGDGSTAIRLERGVITNEIAKPLSADESYVVNTPNAVLAVRGTFFSIQVIVDENGDYYTEILTYGGSVECKRVLPDGTVVDEAIMVNAGFKTRIKMDATDTVYVVETTDPDGKTTNTTPIEPDDISDADLVDMLDASRHGHEMFMSVAEIETLIRERDIKLDNYRSRYDGSKITIPDIPDTTTTTTTTSEITTTQETTASSLTTTEETADDTTAETTTADITTTEPITEGTTTALTTTALITSPTTVIVEETTAKTTVEETEEITTTEETTATTTTTVTTTTTTAVTTVPTIPSYTGTIITTTTTEATTTTPEETTTTTTTTTPEETTTTTTTTTPEETTTTTTTTTPEETTTTTGEVIPDETTTTTPGAPDPEETTTTPGAPDPEETTTTPGGSDPEETTTTPGAPDPEETTTTPGAPDPEETTTTPGASDYE